MTGPALDATAGLHRSRCYRCRRPAARCLCPSLPRIPTRTRIDILQHPRERWHPFGTARLVALALPQVRLHTVPGNEVGDLLHPLEVPPDAAVLFPLPGAIDLAALPEAERPRHLIVLDGTWAHARKLHRHNPWLSRLRHVRLSPAAESRYRIRREPRADYLSTLEAIVAALRLLEPATTGCDALLAAFEAMIDRQLVDMAAPEHRGRYKLPRQRPSRRVPAAVHDPALVVVYGESSLPGGDPAGCRELVQWTAVRVRDGARFEVLLRPAGAAPAERHLRHIGITAAELAAGTTLAEACARFRAFCGPGAPVAAWSCGTLRLGAPLVDSWSAKVALKTAWCNVRSRRAGTLETVLAREGLVAEPLPLRGRAGARLANAFAVLQWLRAGGAT